MHQYKCTCRNDGNHGLDSTGCVVHAFRKSKQRLAAKQDEPKDIIALDFDGTLTKNVAMWQRVIPVMKNTCQVLVVTQRSHNQENIETVEQWLTENGFDYLADSVIFTSAAPKFYYLEKMHIRPWILIDDDPKRAVNGF